MRRPVAAALAALALVATGLTTGMSYAADDDPVRLGPADGHQLPIQASPTARQTLDHAAALLHGADSARGHEATLALRDLAAVLPRLSTADRRQARALLARPHYPSGTRRDCARRICIHWTTRGQDAPPNRSWVRTNLRVLKGVWRKEVGDLGYRRPLRDGHRGGNAKFDVYLQDVGSQGLYGYCAPNGPSGTRVKRSYCVLDNDFARSQFGAKPINSLRATAAHEFFHAVQFAYDAREDAWFMEATATWMEERYADGIDDNRQYLPYGQVGEPSTPLDTFTRSGFAQYGNWAFFEYLSQHFGNRLVRRAWRQAGEFPRGGRTYSIDAVKRVLPREQSFRKVYARFVAANTTPADSYPEGSHWPRPAMGDTAALGRRDVASGTLRVDHLAGYDIRVTPQKELDTRGWRLRATVDGPGRKHAPMAAVVVVRKNGAVSHQLVDLDRSGRGHTVVRFNRVQTRRVYFTAVNASTRYDCHTGTSWSCHGTPLDQDRAYAVELEVFRR